MWTNDGPAIYLNADKSKAVKEGDPAAAFLLVASGGQMPESEAERWGLTKSSQVEPPTEEQKGKVEPPANKAKEPPPNKSR